jgi:hypothetical protein
MEKDKTPHGDGSCLNAGQVPKPKKLNPPADYSSETLSLDDFVSKKEFLRRFPNLFKQQEFDWLIKIRKSNGFDACVRKIGKRKLLFHVPSVLVWVDRQAA